MLNTRVLNAVVFFLACAAPSQCSNEVGVVQHIIKSLTYTISFFHSPQPISSPPLPNVTAQLVSTRCPSASSRRWRQG